MLYLFLGDNEENKVPPPVIQVRLKWIWALSYDKPITLGFMVGS